MDDQTHGDEPAQSAGHDVPLKRDRKALRSSSKSSWSRSAKPDASARSAERDGTGGSDGVQADAGYPGTAGPQSDGEGLPAFVPAASEAFQPEAANPGLSPAEELFAGAWSVSAPEPEAQAQQPSFDGPAVADSPAEAGALADADAPADTQKRSFTWGRRQDATEPDAPAEAEGSAGFAPVTEAAPAHPEPYVPPAGFTAPGHPRLGPIEPEPRPTHRGLAGLDATALVTAVLLPPIGFVTAIVALVRGRRLRGWSSDLARAAVTVSLVMTVVFAGVGGYVWFTETENAKHLAAVKADQRAHDLIETTSLPFCGILAEHPTIYSTADPDYGWPAVDAPEGYNAAIAAYSQVWAQLAEAAPEGIAEEAAAISERVAGVVEITNALGNSNREGDLLGLHEKDDLATVESWYVEYCNAPEQSEAGEEPTE